MLEQILLHSCIAWHSSKNFAELSYELPSDMKSCQRLATGEAKAGALRSANNHVGADLASFMYCLALIKKFCGVVLRTPI
mmetsp:Transcript_37944/g.69945  ORF Transcript_37944/g.69945 Transcript_37944/m.69945 type:complete len:80 (+) Transcript_37944:86-325(+)